MAEQAQKEPTMEEILSSIRKIIADDDMTEVPPPAASAPGPQPVPEPEPAVEKDFADPLLAEDTLPQPVQTLGDLPETEEDILAALQSDLDPVAGDTFDDLSEFEAFDNDEPSAVFDEAPQDDAFAVEPAVFEPFEPEPDLQTEVEPAFAAPQDIVHEDEVLEPELPEVTSIQPVEQDKFEDKEPEMTLPLQTPTVSLTDDKTIDAAAGSLGKLFAKVEFGEEAGGNKTIEGLVKDMLRPMLKEWLDENLPGIVDKHVEAEVQRIARRAG